MPSTTGGQTTTESSFANRRTRNMNRQFIALGSMLLRCLVVVAIASVPGTTYVFAQPRLDLPPAAWQPTGARISWKGLSFIVPPGMSGAAQNDLYEMVGLGMRGRGGQCGIVLGEIPSRGDLATYAQDLLVGNLAKLGAGIADSQGGSNLVADRRVGRSADGWRYVELNGMVNSSGVNRARMMLIDHGATVISIFAVSAPGNGCVGLSLETTPNSNTITWVELYYSLKLVGATPSNHLREQILGHWVGSGMSIAAGAGMLQDVVYAANGRYGGESLTATATGKQVSSSGDGSYVVDAEKLAIFPNAGKAEAHLTRVVEDYSVMTPSKPTVQLCSVRVDVAGPYERCLSRR
jgi:hypothetical protein